MALVKVTCKKCLEETMMDIGELGKEEVIKLLSNDRNGFHCFGHHVEFGNRIDFWTIDWDSLKEGNAPSEEEFLAKLKKEYREVYHHSEVQKYYRIVGFSYGMCSAVNLATGKDTHLHYTNSPKGERYYIA